MKRLECLHRSSRAIRRACQAAVFALCAAGFGGPALAAGSVVKTVPEMTQAVAQADPMPSALDCLPCASCYLAPAPAAHGFTGEVEEPKQTAWQLLAKPSNSVQQPLDLPEREAPVSLRVAYCCCWRN